MTVPGGHNTVMAERPECSAQSSDPTNVGSFLFVIDKDLLSGYPGKCAHSTWLGEARAASSGRNTARAERPGAIRAEQRSHECGVFSFCNR